MVHFTCDMCGREMTAAGSPRFVVRIAAYAAHDPNHIGEDDLDQDHMEAICDLLRDRDGNERGPDDPSQFRGFRFDLCPDCHHRFIKDPLRRDPLRSLNFSKN